MEKTVEVLAVEYVEVPRVQIIEKVVEIHVEVEKIVVNIIAMAEVRKEASIEFGCNADERMIRAEVALGGLVANQLVEWKRCVDAQSAKHPRWNTTGLNLHIQSLQAKPEGSS